MEVSKNNDLTLSAMSSFKSNTGNSPLDDINFTNRLEENVIALKKMANNISEQNKKE